MEIRLIGYSRKVYVNTELADHHEIEYLIEKKSITDDGETSDCKKINATELEYEIHRASFETEGLKHW